MTISIGRGDNAPRSKTQQALESLRLGISSLDGTLTSDLSRLTISGENINSVDASSFNTAVDAISPIIEAFTSDYIDMEQTDIGTISTQQNAAAWGAMLALSPQDTVRRSILPPNPTNNLHKIIGTEGFDTNNLAAECLDSNCGDDMVTSTIMFNMGACQGDTGLVGNLYPMMVIDPSLSGVKISSPLVYIHQGMTHDAQGRLANFQKTNLIRAYQDHTVLESGGVMAIPVWSPPASANFVDSVVIAPTDYTKAGETFQTSYLLDNREVDLIGISQTPNELSRGVADETFALQKDISMSNLAVEFDGNGEIFDFDLKGIPSAAFSAVTTGDSNIMSVAIDTSAIKVGPDTTLINGAAPAADPDITAALAAGYTFYLRLTASGTVDIHRGTFSITANSFTVVKVVDANLVEIDRSTNILADNAANILNNAIFHGWKVKAYMCPQNMSIECIQVNHDCYIEEHYIPYTCTVSTKRPVNVETGTDVDTLLDMVRVKMENTANTHLLESLDVLESMWQSARLEDRPETLGVGRLYVKPMYIGTTIDMGTILTRRAGERHEDIRARINDAITEISSRLYTESNLQAARCHLKAGGDKPTINIITSPHVATYIANTGTFASLSERFNVKTIVTTDVRFDDSTDASKIVITFSNYDSERVDSIDPLSWAVMAYAPEVVYNVNRPSGRGYVRELMVSPRYKPIGALPVAGVINLLNLSQTVLG